MTTETMKFDHCRRAGMISTIKAAGFNTLEEKNVELRAGKTSTLNVQLTIGMLEQTVVVDNHGVSTDADRNADAIVLRERELAALPDDPEALASALRLWLVPVRPRTAPRSRSMDFLMGPFRPRKRFAKFGSIKIHTRQKMNIPVGAGSRSSRSPGATSFTAGPVSCSPMRA